MIINRDAIFNEQLMGGAWSTEDAEDTESLLSTFPFLFDNDSTSDVITTRSSDGITTTPFAEQCVDNLDLDPTHTHASNDNVDIYVDLPIDFEHGSTHDCVDDFEIIDHAMVAHEEPTTYTEAISSAQKRQWQEAMEAKYDSLISKAT